MCAPRQGVAVGGAFLDRVCVPLAVVHKRAETLLGQNVVSLLERWDLLVNSLATSGLADHGTRVLPGPTTVPRVARVENHVVAGRV